MGQTTVIQMLIVTTHSEVSHVNVWWALMEMGQIVWVRTNIKPNLLPLDLLQ